VRRRVEHDDAHNCHREREERDQHLSRRRSAAKARKEQQDKGVEECQVRSVPRVALVAGPGHGGQLEDAEQGEECRRRGRRSRSEADCAPNELNDKERGGQEPACIPRCGGVAAAQK
jgi:hypothetical protein